MQALLVSDATTCPHCGSPVGPGKAACPRCRGRIRMKAPVGEVRPISRASFLPALAIGAVASGALGFVGLPRREDALGRALLLAGFAAGLATLVVWCVLLVRLWGAIQGRKARTTPGRAVGFLFIPLFNVYWIFVALWGWTVDFNRSLPRRSADAPRMPQRLALAVCVLMALTPVPIVGAAASWIGWVLNLLLLNRAIEGVNWLAAGGVRR